MVTLLPIDTPTLKRLTGSPAWGFGLHGQPQENKTSKGNLAVSAPYPISIFCMFWMTPWRAGAPFTWLFSWMPSCHRRSGNFSKWRTPFCSTWQAATGGTKSWKTICSSALAMLLTESNNSIRASAWAFRLSSESSLDASHSQQSANLGFPSRPFTSISTLRHPMIWFRTLTISPWLAVAGLAIRSNYMGGSWSKSLVVWRFVFSEGGNSELWWDLSLQKVKIKQVRLNSSQTGCSEQAAFFRTPLVWTRSLCQSQSINPMQSCDCQIVSSQLSIQNPGSQGGSM